MEQCSIESISQLREVDFGDVPIERTIYKYIVLENDCHFPLTYKVSNVYILDTIDRVFNVYITSSTVNPGDSARVKITFKPNVVGQSFTEYYQIDDTGGNTCRLTVTGKCFGSQVRLDKNRLKFQVQKNVSTQRTHIVALENRSAVDTTYQWYMPAHGQGYFQIFPGHCGVIRARETITTTVSFTGIAIGVYTAEVVCLVQYQEPLYLNLFASVEIKGVPLYEITDHIYQKNFKNKSRSGHLMENSLIRLAYIPSASVFERYLQFGTGDAVDITRNISQTLCVTNHEEKEGYMQWMPDPDNIFVVDPTACMIPPNESRLFTVKFRPKLENELYGYLMCGDFQYKVTDNEKGLVKLKHTWFRIPCIGDTWCPCMEWKAEWDCPVEVILPPTVPTRTTFCNFMLSNKFEKPMHFKFEPPYQTKFAVMPICGVILGRGWHIITVALEPKCCGDYCETWDLILNKDQKTRVAFTGNAETSQVEVMSSHGYHPNADALLEFPPTITGCTNYCTSYLRNLTRMYIHVRVLNTVDWLGADDCGSFVISPKEIVHYHWWFFPRVANKIYDTIVTCSSVCLVDGRPVGEPTDFFISLSGFSEFPDLRVLPNTLNLHDIIVGESKKVAVTLYNFCSCFFTSRLYYTIRGMGDDWSDDRFEINPYINSLKPNKHCQVFLTVTPHAAGAREIAIQYTVLFRTHDNEIEEIQPVTKKICTIWYDGIYPTFKIKRTISVNSPLILSNHCLWNIVNVQELNKAMVDSRPNVPLSVTLYAPDLYVGKEVELVFVLGCIYRVPVAWSLRREKICDCEMIEVRVGTSLYEMRHSCLHRTYLEIDPLTGIVSPDNVNLWTLKLRYGEEGLNTLCYSLTLPNQRLIYIYVNIFAYQSTLKTLTPLRRVLDNDDYLAVLDCGAVPINNLDPVIRVLWLYNPTNVYTTWRLLKSNQEQQNAIKCLLYFVEVPPLSKVAIPFAFIPSEMINYEHIFLCSFGFDSKMILVKGQGGTPTSFATRVDLPFYVERIVREAYRKEVVYLSVEHIILPPMPTHSIAREVLAINNDTDHVMRFIWLPETIGNIYNIIMTPCWGSILPKQSIWITMSVYTMQEPATFTSTVVCEILDLTERKRYQRNEGLKRAKILKCQQEFVITEEGTFYPDINDSPPYVEDIPKPEPRYLSLTVAIQSLGQRDGYKRMRLRHLWEQPPPYDLLSYNSCQSKEGDGNNMKIEDVIVIIDQLLWDALHSKMFRARMEYYATEELPTYTQLMEANETCNKENISRRVSAGICEAIVNKAIFYVFDLRPKYAMSILEAE